jgi:hypothetical protein
MRKKFHRINERVAFADRESHFEHLPAFDSINFDYGIWVE